MDIINKVILNLFSDAEKKYGIKDSKTVEVLIEETPDKNGYLKNYKDDHKIIIYKKNTSQVFCIQENILRLYFSLGGVNSQLGYPESKETIIFENTINYEATKQYFNGGIIYSINDLKRSKIYNKETFVKYFSEMKIQGQENHDFYDYKFPAYTYNDINRQADPVNIILLVKNQIVIKNVFEKSGWIKPKFSWKNLPVSVLNLWNRPQDLAFANDTSPWYKVYKSRNHIRLWNTKLKQRNSEIWIGTATKDIVIKLKDPAEKIQERIEHDPDRYNPFTHGIFPNTDNERDFVFQSLYEHFNNLKISYIYAEELKDKQKPVESINAEMDLVVWDAKIAVIDISSIK